MSRLPPDAPESEARSRAVRDALAGWVRANGSVVLLEHVDRLDAMLAVVEYPGGRYDVIRAFWLSYAGRAEVSVDLQGGTAAELAEKLVWVLR